MKMVVNIEFGHDINRDVIWEILSSLRAGAYRLCTTTELWVKQELKKKQNVDKMRRFSKRRRIKNRFVGRKFHFNQNGFFGLLKVCTCFSISMVSMTSQLFFLRERHMIDKANHIRDLMLLTSHYLVHKNIFLENLDPTFALFAQI